MSLSRLTISGTVIKKPEKKTTPSNVPVTNTIIAVTYIGRGANITGELKLSSQLVKVNAWRDLADYAETLNPGDKVIVSGRAQINSYMANDNVRKREVEIDASSIELLDKISEIQLPAKSEAEEAEMHDSNNSPDLNQNIDNAEEIPF